MEYLEIYKKYAEMQVKKSYKEFENFYKASSMDLEDIEQEIKLMVWDIVEKKKGKLSEEELCKYVGKSVSFALKDWIMNCVKMEVEDNIFIFTDNLSLKTPQDVIKELKSDKKIDDLEARILYKKYVENKSLGTIAKEEGLKKRRIDYLYIMLVKRYATKANKKHYIQNTRFADMLDDETLQDSKKDEIELCIEAGVIKPEDFKSQIDNSEFFFESLKPLLEPNEYEVIYKTFVEQRSFTEIGPLLNVSPEWVGQLYSSACKKLKKKLKKDFAF